MDHAARLVVHFDTATPFAISFWVKKIQLARHKVLVGEYAEREGRAPNPDIIRAMKKWPTVNTLRPPSLPRYGELRSRARRPGSCAECGSLTKIAEAVVKVPP